MLKLKLFAGFTLTALVLMCASPAGAATQADVRTSDVATARAIISQAVKKAQKSDFKGAEADLQSVVDNPNFAGLDSSLRFYTLYLLAVTENADGDGASAYNHLVLAGHVSPELLDEDYWNEMFSVAVRANKPDDIADAVTALATGHPDKLNDIDDAFLSYGIRKVKEMPDGTARYQQMLEALHAAHYHPSDVFWSYEYLWSDLTRIYADAGRTDDARRLAATLTEPGAIMALQIDKRYTGIAPADGAYATALANQVVKFGALASAHPDKIEGQRSLADRLADAGKLDDALAVLDAAIAKASTGSLDKPAFSDLDTMNWVLDTRTRVLAKLGRWDDVITSQIKARDAAKDDIVSQKINLGEYYDELGRPGEAIAELKDFDPKTASPYGIMSAEEVRACAYAQLKDTANLTKSITYLTAHADDGYSALQSALLCAGDVDALANLTVKRLNDPKLRTAALVDQQIYLPQPHPTPWDQTRDSVRARVSARPDVRAAIDTYGVIHTYPTFRD